MALTTQMVRVALEGIKQRNDLARSEVSRNPFKLPDFPARAVPAEPLRMAMDSNIQWASSAWTAGAVLNAAAAEGLMFPGYTYLSELAQRPEYRIISETIADDCTRKWIDFDVVGNEDEENARKDEDAEDPAGADERREERVEKADLGEKVRELTDFLEQLETRDKFYDLICGDGTFGRMHLHLSFGERDSIDPATLRAPVGDGRDNISKATVGPKNPLRRLKVIEPVWTYPMGYNAVNPLLEDWYNPQYWYVMGQEIHVSRILPFISRPVPDILKPSYAFGGISLSQLAEPYVNIWLQTRQSVAQMIHSFSTVVLQTDLQTLLQANSADNLMTRMELFNLLRDNAGSMVVNKETEDLKVVAAPLSGLHELQAQAQEHMTFPARIPLVKLTGIQPSGLNASSEGEIRVYYDTITSMQNRTMRPRLTRIINFAQLSLWGEIDPRIKFDFKPLMEMSDKESAELQKAKAERDKIYVDGGAISPEEWRGAIIDDPDLPYAGLDPEEVPDLKEEEEQGLVPGKGGAGGLGGGGGGEGGGDFQAKDAGSATRQRPGGAGDVLPFGLDADFQESDHPRAPDGKFSKGGGGTSGNAPIEAKNMEQVGEQKGSNPGGVYKDKTTGQEYYIKTLKSKHHAANETLAANLFQIAGGNTLKYHQVTSKTASGISEKHVATAMAKLDKGNLKDLSPAEKKEAQKDFVANAWLANWDAAGAGGDNIGVVNGKPTTLDFGGSLAYRAQGAPKGAAFADTVGELDSMRDPQISQDNFKLYGSMTPEDVKESAKRVTSIPNKQIIKAVQDAGGTPELAQKLLARKADIAKQFDLPTDVTPFDESKFKRNPDGTFAAKNLPDEPKMEKPGAEEYDDVPKPGAYGGLWKTGGSGSPNDNWATNSAFYTKAKAQIGIHYRRMMAKLFKDADKFGASPELKETIKDKLVESLQMSVANAQKKGKDAEVKKLQATIEKLTGKKSATTPESKATPGALAPAEDPDDDNEPMHEEMIGELKSEAAKIQGQTMAMPLKALGILNHADKLGIPLDLAMGMLNESQQKWVKGMHGSPENAVASEKQKIENSKPKEEKAKADQVNKLKDKFAANMADKPAEYKVPLNVAKQKIKAAVQTGAPLDVAESLMDDGEKAALKAQYGSVQSAFEKSKAYADSEAQASKTQAEATEKASDLKAKQAKQTAAQKSAAQKLKEQIDKHISDESADEIHGPWKAYENKAAQKIKALGYEKYITPKQAAPILAYTASHYADLNAEIREGVMSPDQYVFMKKLNDALDRLPPHTDKTFRKASLNQQQFAKYKPGMVIEERAFTSSAKHEGVWSGSYHYEIYGKSGRDVSKLSVQGTSEAEVLFKSGTRFLVEKIEGNKIVMHEV